MDWLIDGIQTLGAALAGVVFSSTSLFGVEIQFIVLWLFAAMVFFTVRLGFLNIRGFTIGWNILGGRHSDPDAPGELSPFQALSTALSSTVGLGNIAGVAIAIAVGGPGAAFWMICIGFFAMSLKFAEVTLAVRYRVIRQDGTVSGGPMWYLSRGLAAHNMPRLGKLLGGLYGIFALFAFIQVIQVNQSYSQLREVTGIGQGYGWALAYGIVIAALAAIVLLGGVRSIGRVTSRLTPFMCGLYILGVLIVLTVNFADVPEALVTMVSDAFSADAAAGGIAGAFVAGMRRAAYSNEAGIGSASIAHAAVKTRHPASEGYVALIEPFIDTIVICAATALVIITTGVWDDGYGDIAMTSAAFGTVSTWFPWVLAGAVCLFAFSTILAAGYYSLQVIDYFFRHSLLVRRIYLCFFCGLLPIGAIVDVTTVTNLIDSLFFMLSVPNLIGVYLMHNVVSREARDFRQTLKSYR
ncbi:sodium:alanine symporter family protein [Henriciella sp.]|uniref:alanine/glycine:cation symporter family protein n=1 Tax=Henriciella sp. TaxID=1968823 RepID=UPI002613473F|nr:amino acid carrier protein [Henriciella sp.]